MGWSVTFMADENGGAVLALNEHFGEIGKVLPLRLL
jgi:hypothetical protein